MPLSVERGRIDDLRKTDFLISEKKTKQKNGFN